MAPTADRLIRTLDEAQRLGVSWAGGPDARGHDGWHGGWFSDGVPVAMS